MDIEDDFLILHWLPHEDRWETIPWAAWYAFMIPPRSALPGISGGVHHFTVVVFDGEDLVNIIPHKYLIEPDGSIGRDNFSGLTKEEREDDRRMMLARELTAEDKARLEQIREKMSKVYRPPPESIAALKSALRRDPKAGSPAERLLSQHR